MNEQKFTLDKLRMSQDFAAGVGAVEVITSVPFRKPRPDEFVRTRPGNENSDCFCFLEQRLQTGTETYLVFPKVAQQNADLVTTRLLFTAVNTEGVPFLWPVRNPGNTGRKNNWNESALDAAVRAESYWLRVFSDQSAGCYRCIIATAQLPEPRWPKESLVDLLNLAFRDRIIDSNSHPVLRRLREGA